MSDQSEHLERLGRQLEAIDKALEAARDEPDPEQRERWLKVVERAATAAHLEYAMAIEEADRRPRLRIIRGGAVIAACAAGAHWLREFWRAHPQAGVAMVGAALAVGAVVALIALSDDTSAPGGPRSPVVAGPRGESPPPPAVGTAPPVSPTAHVPAPSVPAPPRASLSAAPDPGGGRYVSVSYPPHPTGGPRVSGSVPASIPASTPAGSPSPVTPPPGVSAPPPPTTVPPGAGPVLQAGGLCLGLHLPPLLNTDLCLLGS